MWSEQVKGGINMLRDRPHFSNRCHEVMVTFPSGDNVKVQMVSNSSTGTGAYVTANIQSGRAQTIFYNSGAALDHLHQFIVFLS